MKKAKIVVDILMTMIFILLMCHQVTGAFDTLSHCMETYFGKPSENNVSDEITETIMRNVIRNIREVIKHPEDVTVRSELM